MTFSLRTRRPSRSIRAVTAAVLVSASALATTGQASALELEMPAIAGGEALPGYPHPVQHEGAPVPQPFGPDYLAGYISDISAHQGGVYWEIINGFDDLRANHPDVMAQNLEHTVAINNEAPSIPGRV